MTDDQAPEPRRTRTQQRRAAPQLVAHLRDNRTEPRQQWAERITEAHLLSS